MDVVSKVLLEIGDNALRLEKAFRHNAGSFVGGNSFVGHDLVKAFARDIDCMLSNVVVDGDALFGLVAAVNSDEHRRYIEESSHRRPPR
jgi:hypothetical protein